MARKATPKPPTPDPELAVTREEAAQKLGERINSGDELYARKIESAEQLDASETEYRRWNSYNTELLQRLFTTHKFQEEYSSWFGVIFSTYDESLAEKINKHKEGVRDKIIRLESIRDRLELIPVAVGVEKRGAIPVDRERTNKVFVVHGHDESARESVARFLERIGLDAVILHEQPTGGRTIVEKLEYYADVDYAVVLLTPDDVGGAKATPPERQLSRARQNVILELGFFVGKLDRKHVCALYKGHLELPSDYLGVGYVALDDAGGWRLELAKELRCAGFRVDMNQAM